MISFFVIRPVVSRMSSRTLPGLVRLFAVRMSARTENSRQAARMTPRRYRTKGRGSFSPSCHPAELSCRAS